MALTFVNAWMVVHRREGYLFRYVSEGTLASPAEALRITHFSRDSTSLTLHTEPAIEAPWELRVGEEVARVPGPHPRITPRPGVHEVRLAQRVTGTGLERRLPRTISLTLVVDPAPPGQLGVGETSVLAMSVPFGEAPRYPLATLATQPQHYPEQDVTEGRRIVAALDLPPASDPVGRVERLIRFVHEELDPHRGVPSEAMLRRHGPLEQLDRARRGLDAVHCANFTAVYTYFAALAGIPTREVTVTGERGGVLLGGHTFAESYLPERGGWAYVDVTFGLGLVQGPDGRFLDALRLSRLHEAGTLGELTVAVLGEDGALRREPYADHARFSRLYLNRDATYLYHRPERDRHAPLSQVSRMALGSDLSFAHEPVRERHLLKQAALAAQLLLGLLWLGILARWAWRRRRCDGSRALGPSQRLPRP